MLGGRLWLVAGRRAALCASRLPATSAVRPQSVVDTRSFSTSGDGPDKGAGKESTAVPPTTERKEERQGHRNDRRKPRDDFSPRRKEAGGRGAEGERPAKPDEERDPFGFFDLKNRVKGEKQAQDEGTAPPEVKVFRNKYMRRGAEKGPRKERAVSRAGDTNAIAMGPDGLYGPGVLDDEDTYEEAGYAMWLKEKKKRDEGGMCEGRLQRRGNQPLLCRKVDLEELHFANVPIVTRFLTPSGHIKPRRLSQLCARCQRVVARCVKRSRHMGMIPHTMGVDIYKRLDVPPIDDDEDEGVIVTQTKAREPTLAERVKALPSRTI